MKIRFTIRDLLWLMVVVGLAITLLHQRQQTFLMRSAWEYELSRNVAAELRRTTHIDVVEVTLKDLATFVSNQHGFECVLSDGVDGEIPLTGKFAGMPLDSALTALLKPHGLGVRATDTQIVIEKSKLSGP